MNYKKLFEFYTELQDHFRSSAIPFRLIGGQAAMAYKLAEFTKDCDIAIKQENANTLLSFLFHRSSNYSQVRYRLGSGAPIDARWGKNGWTSHLEILTQDFTARLDIFMTLPRVDEKFGFESGVSSLHVLAETKKTQRDRDWDFVKAMGLQLINSGDTRGFLHIFEKTLLVDLANQGHLPPEEILNLRPSLRLLIENSDKLEAALLIERLFWQKWDYYRLRAYLESARQYTAALRKSKEKFELPIQEQHKFILELAEKLLPENPFNLKPVNEIVQNLVNEIFLTFPKEFERYLPNQSLLLHHDGVYNPALC